ncbi:uncharacterized protein LOC131874251 [Cryptomeria japonica]|uniref:uncharacterized protein LOC131874251 n=1 Tax=Cryptomeria japonica TaxID=3369 RepID=UPI0027DA6C48|nr:uncharacterized protein LOC131874251 [Cryptomeria japonica]
MRRGRYIMLMNGLMNGIVYDWAALLAERMYEFLTLQHRTFYMPHYAIGLFLDAMREAVPEEELEKQAVDTTSASGEPDSGRDSSSTEDSEAEDEDDSSWATEEPIRVLFAPPLLLMGTPVPSSGVGGPCIPAFGQSHTPVTLGPLQHEHQGASPGPTTAALTEDMAKSRTEESPHRVVVVEEQGLTEVVGTEPQTRAEVVDLDDSSGEAHGLTVGNAAGEVTSARQAPGDGIPSVAEEAPSQQDAVVSAPPETSQPSAQMGEDIETYLADMADMVTRGRWVVAAAQTQALQQESAVREAARVALEKEMASQQASWAAERAQLLAKLEETRAETAEVEIRLAAEQSVRSHVQQELDVVSTERSLLQTRLV